MYCDGYKGRLRTTRIALVAKWIGCMRTTKLALNSMDRGQSKCCEGSKGMLRTIGVL